MLENGVRCLNGYLFGIYLVSDNVVGCCNVDIFVEDIGVVTLVYLI